MRLPGGLARHGVEVAERLEPRRADGVEPIRVVVVEEEPTARGSLADALDGEADIEVAEVAGDGLEAVEVVPAVAPDVVVMDLVLPELDGVSATRILTGGEPSPAVLGLTSEATEEVALEAIRAGAAGLCPRDGSPDTVAQAVRLVASGDVVVAPAVVREALEPQRDPAPDGCTPREREVLELVARGATNPEICERLVISDATARTHVRSLRRKLCARSRVELVVRAYELGYVLSDGRRSPSPRS